MGDPVEQVQLLYANRVYLVQTVHNGNVTINLEQKALVTENVSRRDDNL